jgi:hypothetical protein
MCEYSMHIVQLFCVVKLSNYILQKLGQQFICPQSNKSFRNQNYSDSRADLCLGSLYEDVVVV